MDPQNLLNQFMGPGGVGAAKDKLSNAGIGGVAGGLAAGGVLGLLVGNKKARKTVGKMAGGAVGLGGAAVLGALAHRAYSNWQTNKQAAPAPQPQAQIQAQPAQVARSGDIQDQVTLSVQPPPPGSPFLPETAPAKSGQPFELALVSAMIAAANADGHIDQNERSSIFEKVNQFPLDAEDKGYVFDALSQPPSLQDIAAMANGPEQAAELYLASRMVVDMEHPMEQAYMQALASRLNIAPELAAHLDAQVAAVEAAA